MLLFRLDSQTGDFDEPVMPATSEQDLTTFAQCYNGIVTQTGGPAVATQDYPDDPTIPVEPPVVIFPKNRRRKRSVDEKPLILLTSEDDDDNDIEYEISCFTLIYLRSQISALPC